MRHAAPCATAPRCVGIAARTSLSRASLPPQPAAHSACGRRRGGVACAAASPASWEDDPWPQAPPRRGERESWEAGPSYDTAAPQRPPPLAEQRGLGRRRGGLAAAEAAAAAEREAARLAAEEAAWERGTAAEELTRRREVDARLAARRQTVRSPACVRSRLASPACAAHAHTRMHGAPAAYAARRRARTHHSQAHAMLVLWRKLLT
jgi:hypothetical protein